MWGSQMTLVLEKEEIHPQDVRASGGGHSAAFSDSAGHSEMQNHNADGRSTTGIHRSGQQFDSNQVKTSTMMRR